MLAISISMAVIMRISTKMPEIPLEMVLKMRISTKMPESAPQNGTYQTDKAQNTGDPAQNGRTSD